MTPEEQILYLQETTNDLKDFIKNIQDISNNPLLSDSAKVQQIKTQTNGIVWGCMNKNASNFDRFATMDDGSCAFVA